MQQQHGKKRKHISAHPWFSMKRNACRRWLRSTLMSLASSLRSSELCGGVGLCGGRRLRCAVGFNLPASAGRFCAASTWIAMSVSTCEWLPTTSRGSHHLGWHRRWFNWWGSVHIVYHGNDIWRLVVAVRVLPSSLRCRARSKNSRLAVGNAHVLSAKHTFGAQCTHHGCIPLSLAAVLVGLRISRALDWPVCEWSTMTCRL